MFVTSLNEIGNSITRQRSNSRDKQCWNNVQEDWIHQEEEEDRILEQKEEEDWIWGREKVQQELIKQESLWRKQQQILE